jgi:hypothetical protein
MFVVVSDVDSKHGLSGCARQWFSSATRQWFVGRVFVQFWPAMACFAGPSLVHIVRAGCDTVGFFHKEGPVQC